MKESLVLSLCQLDIVRLQPTANLERMAAAARAAAEGGAELVVFPELATVGYCEPRSREYGRALAEVSEPVPGPLSSEVCSLARELGVYILYGASEAHPTVTALLFNAAVLVSPEGTVAGVQRKVHIPGEEKHYFAAGGSIEVWDTDLGRVACCVCADLRFPEMARVAALRGAEVQLVIANAQESDSHPHETDRFRTWAQTRAAENANFVALCNRVGFEPPHRFAGRSCIVDPSGGFLAQSHHAATDTVAATLSSAALLEERTYRPSFGERQPNLYAPIVESR
jgi:omega-amidase